MSLYTFLESLPENLPTDHPLHHLRALILKKYVVSYTHQDLWTSYWAEVALQNTQFPVNYFRTVLVLILAKFKYFLWSKTIYQPSSVHPCRLEQKARLALEIDNNSKARLFEILKEPQVPYYNDWVKTTPIHVPPQAVVNHRPQWGYVSPDVNDFIKHTTISGLPIDTLNAIACNPWITIETAQKLIETGYRAYPYTYSHRCNVFLNTAIPIDFFLSHPTKQNSLRYLPYRPDADLKKLQPLIDRPNPAGYPNSSAEEVVALFKKARSYKIRIHLLQHPAMPEELIIDTLKKTKNPHIRWAILRSHPLDAFTALTYARDHHTEVNLNLMLQKYNTLYKPIAQWLCETAASPETFFITSPAQRTELLDRCDAYLQEGRTNI